MLGPHSAPATSSIGSGKGARSGRMRGERGAQPVAHASIASRMAARPQDDLRWCNAVCSVVHRNTIACCRRRRSGANDGLRPMRPAGAMRLVGCKGDSNPRFTRCSASEGRGVSPSGAHMRLRCVIDGCVIGTSARRTPDTGPPSPGRRRGQQSDGPFCPQREPGRFEQPSMPPAPADCPKFV